MTLSFTGDSGVHTILAEIIVSVITDVTVIVIIRDSAVTFIAIDSVMRVRVERTWGSARELRVYRSQALLKSSDFSGETV